MQSSQQILSDNVQHLAHLDMIANEGASGQVKDSFFTQSVPRPKSSILKHIHFHEANKFKTLKSDEQIDDHIDLSVHSIEMPFEPTLSFHLNRIKEFEYKKHVEEVIHVHEVCILDNYSQYLKNVIKDCLATCAHYVE